MAAFRPLPALTSSMFATAAVCVAIAALAGSAEGDRSQEAGAMSAVRMSRTESALIQKRPAILSQKDGPDGSPGMDELLVQYQQIVAEVEELKQRLNKVEVCCETTQEYNKHPGYCAVFGDPHFTTFDGAHTILLREQTSWLVKSEKVWIQAISKAGAGFLMGVAVSGPFLHGHTLLIFNSTLIPGSSTNPFTVLLDGVPILDKVDQYGNARFSKREVMLGIRNSRWDHFVFDQDVLEIQPGIEFDVGNWSSRFEGAPAGGVYDFRFPQGVRLTASGVDYMSAVVRMTPQAGGQTGYCGNFNGDALDEFEPPLPGSVPDFLIPAWNTPVGDDLEAVPESQDLFKTTSKLPLGTFVVGSFGGMAAGPQVAASPKPCSEQLLSQAKQRCSEGDDARRAACIFDVCQTGNLEAARSSVAVDIIEGKFEQDSNVKGVVFVGHGRCRDAEGKQYRTVGTVDVSTPAACQELLAKVSKVESVWGAQMQRLGDCEIVVDAHAVGDVADALAKEAPEVAWGRDESSPSAGSNSIRDVSPLQGWECWRTTAQ